MRYPNEGQYCFVDGTDLVTIDDPRIGTLLAGRYVIEEVIGEGGMAIVYRGRHKLFDRTVAIKIMNPMLATDRVVRERFRREARSAQKLAHPNIIEIYEEGDTDDGTAYIVMEILRGKSLAEIILDGALPIPRALGIMIQLSRGIARAHDFEVIHRDLKPENVFVSQREDGSDLVKLLDFGIARSRSDSRLTGAGELFGTPHYMAPERITGNDAGPAADLYALGVVFFEIVTGQMPFDAPDIATYFVKHLNEKPRAPSTLNPAVPPALDTLILTMMEKDAKMRPVDAHRVHQDLVDIAIAIGARVPLEPESDEESVRRPESYVESGDAAQWAKRTNVLARMLTRAFGALPPADLARKLSDVTTKVKTIAALQQSSIDAQKTLEQLEQRAREGRQRFGFAVDALGVDASKARDEARVSRAMAELAVDETKNAAARVLVAQREVTRWEGRSAFVEPYEDLAIAYRHAASEVDLWCNAKREATQRIEEADRFERSVSDLEFQIKELRAALAKLEQSTEAEQQQRQEEISSLGKQIAPLEDEILALTALICEPLRTRPDLAQFFKELEAHAAA